MLILSSRKELGYALAKIMAGEIFIRVALYLTYVLRRPLLAQVAPNWVRAQVIRAVRGGCQRPSEEGFPVPNVQESIASEACRLRSRVARVWPHR